MAGQGVNMNIDKIDNETDNKDCIDHGSIFHYIHYLIYQN